MLALPVECQRASRQRNNKAKEQMMAAHTPEAVHAEWMKAFNAGNLAGMVALYEPDSAVVSEPESIRSRPLR
jgi:ketosteroid isomerase-like protein